MPQLLEVSEAAKLIGVSTRMLHELLERGAIPCRKTGRGWKLVDPNDISSLLLTVEEIETLIHNRLKDREGIENGNGRTAS